MAQNPFHTLGLVRHFPHFSDSLGLLPMFFHAHYDMPFGFIPQFPLAEIRWRTIKNLVELDDVTKSFYTFFTSLSVIFAFNFCKTYT